MQLTVEEVKERLRRLDEVSLLELLALNSDDLVTSFSELIEDCYEQLLDEVDWDENE